MKVKRTLSRFSLPDRVADQLREMIVTGELEWGTKVPMGKLSEQLSVSPTPLREALKVLAVEGLVELLPNRGARVAHYTPEDARHLFEVIASLESRAAEMAAERMSSSELAALETLHVRMCQHFEAGEREPYFRLNSQIHAAIIAGAHNPVLGAVHSRLMIRTRRGRYLAIGDPQRWTEAVNEHEQVMAALRDHDSAKAAAIWRVHLEHTGEATVRALERAAPRIVQAAPG